MAAGLEWNWWQELTTGARRGTTASPRRPKVFIIGPSKCATTALHRFFADQGVDSVHCRDGRAFVGIEIEVRKDNPGALKGYLDRHTVYSDMVYARTRHPIDAARHFRQFHALYPDAFFIFNDRDEDKLIQSLARHRGGMMMRNLSVAMNRPSEALLDDARHAYRRHKAEVLEYFAGSERFLHFRVDRDPIDVLIRFLSPDFTLSSAFWQRHNVTGQAVASSATSPRRRIRRQLLAWARCMAIPFIEIDPAVYAKAPLIALMIDECGNLLG